MRQTKYFGNRPVWRAAYGFYKQRLPAKLQHWLWDAGSLTDRLIDQCVSSFTVQVLTEGWQKPFYDESLILGMPRGEYGFVRQVYLVCDGIPWVFARTVIPQSTLVGSVKGLTRLGNQSLGKVLFEKPGVIRGQLQVAKLTPGQVIYESARRDCIDVEQPIWGRRSIFFIKDKPLLVNEVFLPDATCYKA